jgi:hypothetical protein
MVNLLGERGRGRFHFLCQGNPMPRSAPGQGGMMAFQVTEVQKALKGVDYPASSLTGSSD